MIPEVKKHTIVLLQPGTEVTRTYTEYESVKEAVEGLCEIYENNRQSGGDGMETETMDYSVDQVADYYKGYDEVMFLVFDEELSNYMPYDHDWVLKKILEFSVSNDF